MKTLLATLLLCLALTAHAQSPWPRNPKTNKVEFTGVLPWPATARTEAQRRALVRQWYLAKLTDSTPAEVDKDARTVVSPQLLTYAGLPVVAQIEQGPTATGFSLVYNVKLNAGGAGLRYTLASFGLSRKSEGESTELELHLTAPAENEQAALAELRKRLAGAVKGWN